MIQKAQEGGKPFELALVDHLMDGTDGPALARQIREKAGDKAPRLVLVTSMSESQAVDEVFDGGLTKPVLQDDLRRVVQGPDSTARMEVDEESGGLEFVGSPRILVAEDNPINREVMREILDELDIEADLVENGKEAVEALDRSSYPLILMDCQMPEMDGYEATRRIRRREDDRANVPIVAVTAHAVQGEREKAQAAGMSDYITKPVTITRLVRMMAKYLDTRTLEKGTRSSKRPGSAAVKTISSKPPAATAEDGPPALDPGVRRSKAVVGLFRKMVPDQIAGLQESVNAGDSGEVKQGAHKLKGSCLALGAKDMAAVCAELEPNPDNAHALLKNLTSEHKRVLKALDAEEKAQA